MRFFYMGAYQIHWKAETGVYSVVKKERIVLRRCTEAGRMLQREKERTLR